ncbi:3-hydroxyacyl-ACP dehydratase FabZ [Paraburkholderia terricola]|uniref:3-hydroxyacyl-[acyl-carrier-protein] dehydratase n=1 Tax=Paraburkholderia terricola TaxID=169427 RepID=A0ABU1M1N0_9BURK|nr:3-hydroxyacyl-ACP dehydratase FabZ [Paraburkholderia terricola]MDR6412832.1 3-hydroxyacyl-[acyl-carrier-protein] dehydratase [Paraburkholderia terricola]MDR6450040.1 3-hydroxyacyl-[acyl-carrier-protein] dehydratase [Paraburkholderia terricola]MDR6484896.1 3-hydroxyacyl-[acyl-carrier-protein] dehydratase [Paraburkholderia terricola]
MPEITQTPLTPTQIMKRLPHRHPFLMIDKVTRYGDGEAVAVKSVTMNEWFFAGHFPNDPVMPGVLIGEAMAQTSAFVHHGGADPVGSARLVNIDLQLKAPVLPGEQLVLTARCIKRFGQVMKISAIAQVSDVTVATAELTVAG